MSEIFESILFHSEKLSKEEPYRVLIRYVHDDEKNVSSRTAKELYDRALTIGNFLITEKKFKKGDRVILVYPPGIEFVEAFLACLYVGIIPVPVCPPQPIQPEIGLPGYLSIVSDSGACAQLTSLLYSRSRTFGRILTALKSGPKWPDLQWIITDSIKEKQNLKSDVINQTLLNPVEVKESDLAFLQYTSGSTRAPKGVCISYGNLHAQIQLLEKDGQMGKGGVSVFWMPHFHDFALIGGIIAAISGSNALILFSPEKFLRRPELWGELMHRYEATHVGAPDFGYYLFSKKSSDEARKKWDLSHLKVMMSAAEPIRPKTVDLLFHMLKDSKFNPKVFCPSYGLAEHTIAVSIHGKYRFLFERESLEEVGGKVRWIKKSEVSLIRTNSENFENQLGTELFSCGRPAQGVSVEIVDPVSFSRFPEYTVGEIWVDSKNKALGYFNKDELSREKFHARIKGDDRNWLRTGDLGVIGEGELVVLGRLDDMIILRGRNLYPQDIELIVSESDDRVRPGRVAAFSVDMKTNMNESAQESETQIIIALELKEKIVSKKMTEEITGKIRQRLQQELLISDVKILFLEHGAIPKTTSGKLQRQKFKREWLDGEVKSLR